MGVIVKPLNLNDRQVKRVDRIEESNGTYEGRARRVANRINARRDARGAENPGLAKAMAAKKAMAQPMKKGGKMIKKAKNGTSFGMLSVKAGVDNNANPTAADRIAGAKKKAKFGKKMQYGGEAASMVPTMKKGGKAMYGKSMMSKGGKMKMGGKCKNGC